MRKISGWIRGFRGETSGATAIEYALLAASLGLAIHLALKNAGGILNEVFEGTSTKLQEARGESSED